MCHPGNDHDHWRNSDARRNRLHVSDQDRALDFYTNVVGFEQRADNPTPDGPRFLTVAVKGQDFQLILWPGTPGQAQPVDGRIPAAYTIETGIAGRRSRRSRRSRRAA